MEAVNASIQIALSLLMPFEKLSIIIPVPIARMNDFNKPTKPAIMITLGLLIHIFGLVASNILYPRDANNAAVRYEGI